MKKPRPPIRTPFTGNDDADALLSENPFALLVGMLLDQQVPMEWAFAAPAVLKERLGGELDPRSVAARTPDDLEAVFRAKPALHRYPGSMAKRTHAIAAFIVEHYDGETENIWREVETGAELYERLLALPGYGKDKARIFVGVLGKRLGVCPQGWEAAAADWPSIADVDRHERVLEIREQKRAMKAAKKATKNTAPKKAAKKTSASSR